MARVMIEDTISKTGETLTVMGWVHSKRDHGKITFVDLRDRTGLLQCVGSQDLKELHPEDVVAVTGQIVNRSDNTINPDLPTGRIELQVEAVRIYSHSQALPFPIDTDGLDIDEDIRLKYRYLDIRRPRLTNILRTKFKVNQFIRQHLEKEGFIEVETPILTKTTPEGARDFIVPSRLKPGNFYALPQSPQQYKQLLMVAGIERYFQFARCFRDEDPRADRAYGEFTQLDMELSFVSQEDILQLIEQLFTSMVAKLFPEKHISTTPWPRISHREAIAKYGTDKPDLRQDPNDPNELAFSWTIDFPLFTEQSDDDFYHGSGQAKFAPSHHMFTAPHPDDIPLLDTDPTKVRGLQHDLVLNGYEVGGGSIRIHQADIQSKVFDLIGFSAEQKSQFEHMLTAFTYGVPPHGGIAPGIDRFIMVLLGQPSIREVMAFPATASGRTAVVDAPSKATDKQLEELSITTVSKQFDSVALALKDRLERAGVSHRFIPKDTPADKSISLKTMVLEIEDSHAIYVLPADSRLDLKALRGVLKTSKVNLLALDQIEPLTKVEPGAIPAMGSLMKLPTYLDQGLREAKHIRFASGDLISDVVIKLSDYISLENPKLIALQ